MMEMLQFIRREIVIKRILPRPIFFLSLSLIYSCSTAKKIEMDQLVVEEQEHTIRPGEVRKIELPKELSEVKGVFKCKGQIIPTFLEGKRRKAFVSETYFSKLSTYQCTYHTHKKTWDISKMQVKDKKFPSERLYVDKKRVVLSAKDLKRVEKEQVFLNKNYESSPDLPYFSRAFQFPIDSEVTSIYGSRRVFNGKKQTQHLGTDYRAAVGEPIKASNAGKVVVARDLFFTGNTITIDHGLGVFTIYGHLSKIMAQEGEYVPQGAVIGLSGASGRVTGPHLHWGVKVNGHFVEGLSLVEASKE